MNMNSPGGRGPDRNGMPAMPMNRPRHRLRTLTALAVATAGVAAVTAIPAEADVPLYQRAGAPAELRARDLLQRMTLDEKIGQMDQVAVKRIQGDCEFSGGPLNEACMKTVLDDYTA